MHIVRGILRYVYPFTQYFSALLLFATLFVYIVFPALRNNLQGKAMICFLLSILVVQLEYGTLLSLPSDEPHTWCSLKSIMIRFCLIFRLIYYCLIEKTAIYFRYSASTWITVMGFIIWRQLKYNSVDVTSNSLN